MTAEAHATIDAAALRHNLGRVVKLANGARVMAVVKANGYGHGIEHVVRALHEADAFAVARMREAQAVRDTGSDARVLLLEGVMSVDEIAQAARQRFDLVVHCKEQLELLRAYTGADPVTVWLKIDTGMNRLGFRTDEAGAAFAVLNELECVAGPVRLMTHFANADAGAEAGPSEQLRAFDALTDSWPGEQTAANSAGILNVPPGTRDWVRPGLMLYGVSPVPGQSGEDLGLRPAMTLWSRIIAVKPVQSGERVGYGGTWTAKRDTTIGIVAAGYGDGYPWRLPSGTPVLVGDQRVPTVGRVSMDMIAVDLGAQTRVKVGDKAVLWGPGLGVDEIARAAGTIAYELLCGISHRVRMEVAHPAADVAVV